MIYYVDITEQGKKCVISIKGQDIVCQVVSAFEIIKKDGSKKRWYQLEDKNNTIYDYVAFTDIIFKK